MNPLLKDQWALVTGSTKGIGKAIALKLASEGANIVVIGTNEERAKKTVEEVELLGVKAIFELIDVSDYEGVHTSVEHILEKTGGIDILVNNAGITRDALMMKLNEEKWDQVIDVNLKSAFNLCHALTRPMLRARKGKIVNISSVVGLTGNVGQVNYSASKSGLLGLTKSLALEFASRGIQVNCIAPGFIETEMTDAIPEEHKKAFLEKIPLKRMGTGEEIANAVLFFASSLSDYITGQVLTVDGGMVM
jgi:3-oxoacyl-[acyl-carrier protein] reductase